MPRSAALNGVIDQGRSLAPPDLVLMGDWVSDLISGDLFETDVAICGDTIVGVSRCYTGHGRIVVFSKMCQRRRKPGHLVRMCAMARAFHLAGACHERHLEEQRFQALQGMSHGSSVDDVTDPAAADRADQDGGDGQRPAPCR